MYDFASYFPFLSVVTFSGNQGELRGQSPRFEIVDYLGAHPPRMFAFILLFKLFCYDFFNFKMVSERFSIADFMI